MSLREQIQADIGAILNNETDFGEAITLVDPDGATTPMVGLTGDISTVIDPDTGAIVKGRRLHVTVSTLDLPAGPRPEAQNDDTKKPWRVSFRRLATAVVTQYAVVASDPDDAMSAIVLELGEWAA